MQIILFALPSNQPDTSHFCPNGFRNCHTPPLSRHSFGGRIWWTHTLLPPRWYISYWSITELKLEWSVRRTTALLHSSKSFLGSLFCSFILEAKCSQSPVSWSHRTLCFCQALCWPHPHFSPNTFPFLVVGGGLFDLGSRGNQRKSQIRLWWTKNVYKPWAGGHSNGMR